MSNEVDKNFFSNQMERKEHIKEFLKYVNLNELREKICEFRKLNFQKLTCSGINEEIEKVIMFNTPEGPCSILLKEHGRYLKGTRFYRIRALDKCDRKTPSKWMKLVSDCWERPADIVKLGRLNKANEPLLYTVPIDPGIAVEEMKIADGQWFSLIVYEAVEEIKTTVIGSFPSDDSHDDFSDDELRKFNMPHDFLIHEFTRDMGKSTEFLYKLSERITKFYFDLPPHVQDAWEYPSVAKNTGVNVCFRPDDGKSKLKLIGALSSYSVEKFDGKYMFEFSEIGVDSGDGIHLSYCRSNRKVMKSLFPEFDSREKQYETFCKKVIFRVNCLLNKCSSDRARKEVYFVK